MTRKKSRLGRGLGALLGDVRATTGNDAAVTAPKDEAGAAQSLKEVPIERLQRGRYQPRIQIDKQALAELAESIKAQGVLQPLLVRPSAGGYYEIIAGERRWRGAQLAGLSTIPVVVREIADQTAMAVGLIENIQREALNAIEQAQGYQRLIEEFGLTHQETATAVGSSRATITNLLRLLTLHPEVQAMLQNEKLDMGHARTLLALPEKRQHEAALKVHNEQLSVRQTERLVKSWLHTDRSTDSTTDTATNADIAVLEEDLSTRIGAKVSIQHGTRKGNGRLVIHYHSLDELDGILDKIH